MGISNVVSLHKETSSDEHVLLPVLWIRIGFNPDPWLFISMRIRIWTLIKEAKPMRIHVDPDLDSRQTSKPQKVKILQEKYTLN
jgi:hypothetical protein